MAIEARSSSPDRKNSRRRRGEAHLRLVPPSPRTAEGVIGRMTDPQAPDTDVRQQQTRHLTLLEQYNILKQPVVLGGKISEITTRQPLIPQHPSVQDEGDQSLYESPFPRANKAVGHLIEAVKEHPGTTSAVGAAGLEALSLFAEQQAKVLSSLPSDTSFVDLFSSGGPLQWIQELASKGLWEIGGQVTHTGAIILTALAAITFGSKIFRHFFPTHQEEPIEE